MAVALTIGGVILLAMIGVAGYGWVTLPSDAMVPIHFGIKYNNFVSKQVGLAMYPAIGVLVYLIMVVVRPHQSNGSSGKPVTVIIVPVILCVMLATQIGAIMVARRRSAG
jgi:hypothetical protein